MNKVLKWLDNYWYHNKWKTLIALFFIVVLALLIAQTATREDYEVSVLYVGPRVVQSGEKAAICTALRQIVPDEASAESDAGLIDIWLMTEQQQKAYYESADDALSLLLYNDQESKTAWTQQISAGEASICFLDPAWYEIVCENEGFVPLQELLGSQPTYAVDAYAVRLCDTPFGQYFSALSIFPEDTLVAFRCPKVTSFFGRKQMDEQYELQKKAFISLMQFTFPEGASGEHSAA